MNYSSAAYEQDDYIEFKPNDRLLKELVEMGFNKNGATRGLFYTGNRSLDLAANWLVENEATFKGINDPVQPGELSYSYYPSTTPLIGSTATTGSVGARVASTGGRNPESSSRYMLVMYYPSTDAAYDDAGSEYAPGSDFPVGRHNHPQIEHDYNSNPPYNRYNASRNPQPDSGRPQPPSPTSRNDTYTDSMPRVAGLGREYGTRDDASSSLEACSLFIVLDVSLGLTAEEQAKIVARASLKLVVDSSSEFGSAAVLNRLKTWTKNGEVVKVIDCRDGSRICQLQEQAMKRRIISTLIQDKENSQESYSEQSICLALFGPTSVLDQLVQSIRV